MVKTNSYDSRQRNIVFGAVNPENDDLSKQLSNKGNTENFKSFNI